MLILYLSRCKREKTPLSIRICNADALSISIYNAFTPKVQQFFFKRITYAYTHSFALQTRRDTDGRIIAFNVAIIL